MALTNYEQLILNSTILITQSEVLPAQSCITIWIRHMAKFQILQ